MTGSGAATPHLRWLPHAYDFGMFARLPKSGAGQGVFPRRFSSGDTRSHLETGIDIRTER
jgi:hypothetical protein